MSVVTPHEEVRLLSLNFVNFLFITAADAAAAIAISPARLAAPA